MKTLYSLLAAALVTAMPVQTVHAQETEETCMNAKSIQYGQ